uniref:Large ribosomal subunit protein uL4c n=1 Tax=Schizymenia dubyi TaxID=38368 RepID=A0A1C9C9M1_9FLOR|nr:ribosomal protein L4 [Schizymenia dubyi]AOM65086.1 ribosomal protein L4 [Schizymenia dubyi]
MFSYQKNSDISDQKTIILKVKDNPKEGMYIIHRALIKQLNEQRLGNAQTKTRSEVRGGGKKPWKQKGTGRARAGSIRSPLWKGGGVIFGPKAKRYNTKINKKEKQLALRTLIYNKFKQTLIVQEFAQFLIEPNTKLFLKEIKDFGVNINKREKLLIITKTKPNSLYLSVRNISNVELIAADQLNILALIKANKLLITVDALDTIQKIYNG